jgi:hypothetical protein
VSTYASFKHHGGGSQLTIFLALVNWYICSHDLDVHTEATREDGLRQVESSIVEVASSKQLKTTDLTLQQL